MISSQDFDRLSAYVDRQLSSKETAALEARLAREPELKAALTDLRQTVSALRSLPRVKPPRNFTLSAKQVGAASQAQPRLFPMLRLATTFAALALVLVFAGDFMAGRPPALSPAASVPYTTAQQNAVSTEAAPSEATPPPLARAAVPAATSAPTQMLDQSSAAPAAPAAAGAGAVTGGSAPTATTLTPEDNTPMAAAILAASPVTTDTTSAPGGEPPPVAATEPSAAAKVAIAPSEAPAPLAPTETVTAPLTAPMPEAYPPSAATQNFAAAPVAVPVSAPAWPWRTAEMALIGLTLVLAAITWLMRRR